MGVIRCIAMVMIGGSVYFTFVDHSPLVHASQQHGVCSHVYSNEFGWHHTMAIGDGDDEGHIVVPTVEVEAFRNRGYGMTRLALWGPRSMHLVAMLLNSSSSVCHSCSSSLNTYLHWLPTFFICFTGGFGHGYCSFFTVLHTGVGRDKY
jgi:hypothetical protein